MLPRASTMMKNNPFVTRLACYMSNASMAAVACISPLLFVTFHNLYGISYALLGSLVLINFCTQLCVDLVFSFYSHKFNIQMTVRIMPVLTVIGLVIYGMLPPLFPAQAYVFLVLGTVVFSAAAGLAEVLISPVIAALPSDNPERDMSRTHSVYAWGVAVVVLLSTLYLQLFGRDVWYILVLLWTILPLTAFALFMCTGFRRCIRKKQCRHCKPLQKSPSCPVCTVYFSGWCQRRHHDPVVL